MDKIIAALILVALIVLLWKVILFLIALAFVVAMIGALLFSDMDDPCCRDRYD